MDALWDALKSWQATLLFAVAGCAYYLWITRR